METFGASVQALKTGDVDLVLTDGVAGKGYVDASNGTLKLIGGPLGGDDFGFIFKKVPISLPLSMPRSRR